MVISNKGMSVKHRVEFITSPEGDLEIRFFDTCTDPCYRSRRLAEAVMEELISWRAKINTNKKVHYPIKQETKRCSFLCIQGSI